MKYTFIIFVDRVLIVIGYFLHEKLTFNGLLKNIGIHIKDFLLLLQLNEVLLITYQYHKFI